MADKQKDSSPQLNNEHQSWKQPRFFGTTTEGDSVNVYTLTNAKGMSMEVMDFGGVVISLKVPDRDGKLDDIVLGFDRLEPYLQDSPYFGSLIGRYGNRIAKGVFQLDGQEYQLVQNNLGNHLHGGLMGFDKVLWQATAFEHAQGQALKLEYTSKDGEEGYPGNLQVTVTYILREDNAWQIDYEATTDKSTIVNLTQHSYFNLNPLESSILDHQVVLHAQQFLPVDETLIPLGTPESVSGTPFDFQQAKAIGAGIEADHPQIKIGGGYDHCWVINESSSAMADAAEVYEPVTGRVMHVATSEPGIQFYTGNFLDGTLRGKQGASYPQRSGFCLETQHFPDSPNQTNFPSTRLDPGQVYRSTTIYSFSTR